MHIFQPIPQSPVIVLVVILLIGVIVIKLCTRILMTHGIPFKALQGLLEIGDGRLLVGALYIYTNNRNAFVIHSGHFDPPNKFVHLDFQLFL